MDNNGKPKDWKSVIAPETLTDIQINLDKIISKRLEVQRQIDELTQAGCTFGNVVKERRGKYGPYYRLHYYVNPQTGQKAKPRYIKAPQVEAIEREIANYKERAELLLLAYELDKVCTASRHQIEELQRYVARMEKSYRYEQMQLLKEMDDA